MNANISADQDVSLTKNEVKNHKILWVDDEPQVISSFGRILRSKFTIVGANSAHLGLEKLKGKEQFSVIVTDMTMPEMDGIEFLHHVHKDHPEIVCVMLTGNHDQKTAVRATNEGEVFRFLNKPISIDDISQVFNEAITEHKLLVHKRELLGKTLSGCVRVLTDVIQIIDPVIFADNVKARSLIEKLEAPLKLSNAPTLILANMLSGIGLVSIPTNYLVKLHSNQPLSPQERKLFDRIPEISESILSHVPSLEDICEIIRYLKKDFDGGGRPIETIRGKDIPWASRFLRVVKDLAYYHSWGLTWQNALSRMRKRIGTYDPKILDQMDSVFKKEEGVPAILREEKQSEESGLVKIGISEVKIGQCVASDIESKEGILLLKAGELITPVNYERIKNYAELVGVKEPIYVNSLEPKVEDPE